MGILDYGAWNTLRIDYDMSSALYTYSVSGSVAGTVLRDGGAVGSGAAFLVLWC